MIGNYCKTSQELCFELDIKNRSYICNFSNESKVHILKMNNPIRYYLVIDKWAYELYFFTSENQSYDVDLDEDNLIESCSLFPNIRMNYFCNTKRTREAVTLVLDSVEYRDDSMRFKIFTCLYIGINSVNVFCPETDCILEPNTGILLGFKDYIHGSIQGVPVDSLLKNLVFGGQ